MNQQTNRNGKPRELESREMKLTRLSAAVLVALGMVSATGCKSDSEPAETTRPTTLASPTTKPVTPAAPTAAASTPVPQKDMTHEVTGDAQYFATMPAPGKPAAGTLKSGTKVDVLMPRGGYSQVMTSDGKRIYTSASDLKPLGE